MNPERTRPNRFNTPKKPRKEVGGAALKAALAEPSQAWREYLRQDRSERFSKAKTLDLAQKMALGADRKARFCSGSAFAELALLDRANYLSYLAAAKEQFSYCLNMADTPRESITSAVRLYTLPLYKLPHIAEELTDRELESHLDTVREPLSSMIAIAAEALVDEDPLSDKGTTLRGSISEIGILAALQRPDIVRSGLVALPAAPWEDSSLKSGSLFIPQQSEIFHNQRIPISKNKNYDISVIDIQNPHKNIPLQVKTFEKKSFYDDSITLVFTDEVAKRICEAEERPIQRFESYMGYCGAAEKEERLRKVGDHLVDNVLKIS